MSSASAAPGMPTRRSPRLAARAPAAVEPRRSPRLAAVAATAAKAEADYSDDDYSEGCTGLCDIYVREALEDITAQFSAKGYLTTIMIADLLSVIDGHENFFDIVDFPADITGYDSAEINEAIDALQSKERLVLSTRTLDQVMGPLSYTEIYANKSEINERIREYIIEFFNIPVVEAPAPTPAAPRRSPRLAERTRERTKREPKPEPKRAQKQEATPLRRSPRLAAKQALAPAPALTPVPAQTSPCAEAFKATDDFISKFKVKRAEAKAALENIEKSAQLMMELDIANLKMYLSQAFRYKEPTDDLIKMLLHKMMAAVECYDTKGKVAMTIDIYKHIMLYMIETLAKHPAFRKTTYDKAIQLRGEIEEKVREGKVSTDQQNEYIRVADALIAYIDHILPAHPLYVHSKCTCDADTKSDNPDRG